MRRFGSSHLLNSVTPNLHCPRWLWTLRVKAWAREHDPRKGKHTPPSLKRSVERFLQSRHVLSSGQEKLPLALGCKRLLDIDTASLVWDTVAAQLQRELVFKVKRNVVLKVPLITGVDKRHLRRQIQSTIQSNSHTPPLLAQYLCDCI